MPIIAMESFEPPNSDNGSLPPDCVVVLAMAPEGLLDDTGYIHLTERLPDVFLIDRFPIGQAQ